MKYKVLATGSTGNATLIVGSRGTVIGIDEGLSGKKYLSLAENAGIDLPSELFITHSHSDHFNKGGIHVLQRKKPALELILGGGMYNYNEFTVTAFKVPHNVLNHGYIITDNDDGQSMVYITDCSDYDYIHRHYKNILLDHDYYLIEANYDKRYLDNPDVIEQMDYKYNVFNSMLRHSSKQDAIKFFAKCRGDNSQLQFLHQSSRFFEF